jgi:hypothetical protein
MLAYFAAMSRSRTGLAVTVWSAWTHVRIGRWAWKGRKHANEVRDIGMIPKCIRKPNQVDAPQKVDVP